jgi:iron complex outermembrane receptor protein
VTWPILCVLAAQTSTASPALTEKDLLFPEIPSVYAASKYEQRSTDAPSSVTVITSDEIELYGYRTIGEILQSVRSFYVSYDRNYSYVGVRGFQRPGDYNTRLLLLIDGHRTNDAIYDGSLVGGEAVIDVREIDRVEIVRGPSSSVYGTSAFFAVVNLITKRGRDLMGAELGGGAASFNTVRGRASVGHRLGDLEYVVSGSFYESRGADLYFEELDAPETNGGIAEGLDHERSYRLLPKLSYGPFTLQGLFSFRKKGVPTASYGQVFNDPRSHTIDQLWYGEVRYRDRLLDRVNVDAKVFVDDYHYEGDYIYDYSEAGDGSLILVNHDESRGRWWGAEATVGMALIHGLDLTAGLELRHNFEERQANADETFAFEDVHDSVVFGAYAQGDLHVVPTLRLSLGVRFDAYSTFGGTLNPRAALIWQPYESTAIKLLYGQAFRAPNAYELHYVSVVSKAPEKLLPERIRTYELALEQSIDRYARFTGSLFGYEVQDLISLSVEPEDDLLVFRNAEESRAFGLEAEIEARWPDVIEGRASYSFQRAWDPASGERLSSSPLHLVKLNVCVSLLGEALQAGAELQYASSMRTVAGPPSDAFAVLNLSLLSRELADRLTISMHVYNVLGAEYGFPGSLEHAQRVIPQDGRTFRVNATVAF